MSHITIDLGRGMNKEASGSAGAAAPRLPFLRRRKGLVLIILASLTLLVFVNRSHLSGAQSSIRWVKDSMRPVAAADDAALHTATPAAPLPNDFGVGIAQGALAENGVAGSGTDAFRKLAAEQGYNPEEIEKLAAANVGAIEGGSKPTSAEHLLLFFQALSNPSYTVSSWERTWKSQLMPGSEKAFAKTLAQVSGQADVTMYKTNRSQWNAIHRSKNPLTVFSKSYCPYSRKAKELLNSLGAKYNVIEVDLRPKDAESLQAALATLSGHRTFPAVFAGDKLLGGYDDLQTMNQLKVLKGMLQGAGAI